MTAMNHEPVTEPIPRIEAGKDKKKKLFSKKLLAGSAIGLSLFGVGAGFGAMGDKEDAPRPVASGEVMPGTEGTSQEVDYSQVDVQTLTVDEFYDDSIYPQEYRIKWANEIIEQREEQAHAELSSILEKSGYPALGPLVEPSEGNTGPEIMVQHDVINYIASTTANPTEGMKLLAASSDYEISQRVSDTFGQEPIIAFHTVPYNSETNELMESPVFSQAVVGDYSPNGTPSKIVVFNNGINGESSESIERFVSGRWITHDTMGPGDPDLITNPQEITDK